MQTNCPQCSQKLVVEDDKVPAGPFMLRCPKCQTSLKLPGKGGDVASPPAGLGAPPAGKAVSPPAKSVPTAPPAPSAAELTPAVRPEEPTNAKNGQALVVLTGQTDQGLNDAITTLLRRLAYGTEIVTEARQGVRLLEQNTYALVVATPNESSGNGNVSLYKRVLALAPEIRRDLFLLLLGNEFQSGNGPQAIAAMADLVLNPKDLAGSEELLRSTINERTRLFKAFQDAQERLERRKY